MVASKLTTLSFAHAGKRAWRPRWLQWDLWWWSANQEIIKLGPFETHNGGFPNFSSKSMYIYGIVFGGISLNKIVDEVWVGLILFHDPWKFQKSSSPDFYRVFRWFGPKAGAAPAKKKPTGWLSSAVGVRGFGRSVHWENVGDKKCLN